jgi:hypothetical protein
LQFHHGNKICNCGNKKTKKAKQCIYCHDEKRVIWPSPEEIKILVWSTPSWILKKSLGVSDVAIGKFCRKHGIEKPGRGYWAKEKSKSASLSPPLDLS